MRRPGRGRKRPDAGHLAQDQELERALRDALHTVAESIEPAGDGLERIRRRLGEPWLARQISLIRTGCADWLPLALAMAGAVIIAVTGAFAVSQVQRGNQRITLSTGQGASTRVVSGTGAATGSAGQSSSLSSTQASLAQLSPAQPGSTQPGSTQPGSTQPGSVAPTRRKPGGVSSARVKPSWPAAGPAATPDGSNPPSTAATGCPSSPTGTPSATPTLPSPSASPSPGSASPPPPSPRPNPSPVATASGSSAPAVGSPPPACDDGTGRQ